MFFDASQARAASREYEPTRPGCPWSGRCAALWSAVHPGPEERAALARTVAGKRSVQANPAQPGRTVRQGACTFCTDCTMFGVRHDLCPGEIHTAPGTKDDKIWACACWREGHQQ